MDARQPPFRQFHMFIEQAVAVRPILLMSILDYTPRKNVSDNLS